MLRRRRWRRRCLHLRQPLFLACQMEAYHALVAPTRERSTTCRTLPATTALVKLEGAWTTTHRNTTLVPRLTMARARAVGEDSDDVRCDVRCDGPGVGRSACERFRMAAAGSTCGSGGEELVWMTHLHRERYVQALEVVMLMVRR